MKYEMHFEIIQLHYYPFNSTVVSVCSICGI